MKAARAIISVGALSAGLGVAFGAFGAHALDGRVSTELLGSYETAARYHVVHSLGMVAVGLLARLRGASDEAGVATAATSDAAFERLRWSAALMLTGIVLFSGSLYTIALTGERWLALATPLGGIAFLAAWGLLAWAALET